MRLFLSIRRARAWTMVLALGTQACALPASQRAGYVARNTIMPQVGMVTIQNQAGYLSYHAGTLADTQGFTYVRRARGEACQRGIGVPYALVRNFFVGGRTDGWFTADARWGEGTLHEAMRQATATMRGDEAMVDITIDQHQTSVLSVLYREICLVVQGNIMAPAVPVLEGTQGTPLPAPDSSPDTQVYPQAL